MRPRAMHFDAAVVGLGAAGCWAAKVLTENGLSVVALDAGKQLSASDLPSDLKPVGHLGKLRLARQRIQSRSVSFHPGIAHLYVDDRNNPYRTRGGDPFLWIRGRQVGGRLHTWARMALRLSDDDFKRADSDGWGEPWPISYRDLADYYDMVEAYHGLSGSRDGIASLPDGSVSEPAALTEPAALFKERIEGRWPERQVITPRILQHDIEPIHAPLRHALQTGRLRLVAQAPVARVLLNAVGDRVQGVEFVDARAGQTSTVSADRVFLCASAIESVRILLNSKCARHPAGVGNNDGLLGRFILDHNFVIATGSTGGDYRELASSWTPRQETPLNLSTVLDYYVPDYCHSLEDRTFLRGFGMQGTISPTYWGMAVFGEMLPHRDNRVTLSKRTDVLGIPIVNIAVRRRENDRRMLAAQKRQLRMVAETAGLRIEMPLPRILRGLFWKAVGPEVGVLHAGLATHECGGARMGSSPETSVLTHRNQVWGVPNLYVTDGACFPNTGCQNPTLTIMALTARACELAAQDSG